ncbi:MAG: hypothetical protein WCG27_11815, partial [Pseudomonadota bacterium]
MRTVALFIIICLWSMAGIAVSSEIKPLNPVAKPISKIKMSEKWMELDRLVDEEVRTIKAAHPLTVQLKHRLFELNIEKIKLVQEKENKIYLESSVEKKTASPKDSFFTQTYDLYKKIIKFGQEIIADYPSFKNIVAIYYSMAITTRDYAPKRNDPQMERFLLVALRLAGKETTIAHQSHVSLAEYYYNLKKYKEAVAHYNIVLEVTSDEWYPKHLYNA